MSASVLFDRLADLKLVDQLVVCLDLFDHQIGMLDVELFVLEDYRLADQQIKNCQVTVKRFLFVEIGRLLDQKTIASIKYRLADKQTIKVIDK